MSLFESKFNKNVTTAIMRRPVRQRNISKTTVKKEPEKIHFDIFKKFSEETDNTFWKELFDNASKGKFPKFFFYKDGCLTYANNQKKQLDVFCLTKCDDIELNDIIEFMVKNGILPPEDEIDKIEEIVTNCSFETKIRNWGDYKKKDKDHMIEFYIEEMSKSMRLTYVQRNSLNSKILEGIQLGIFNKNNIFVDKDNRISKIDGLFFSKKVNEFVIDPNLKKNVQKKKKDINSIRSDDSSYSTNNTLFTKWKKLLENYEKSYKKLTPLLEPKIEDNTDIITETMSDVMTSNFDDSEY